MANVGAAPRGQLIEQLLPSGPDLARQLAHIALKAIQRALLAPVAYFSPVFCHPSVTRGVIFLRDRSCNAYVKQHPCPRLGAPPESSPFPARTIHLRGAQISE